MKKQRVVRGIPVEEGSGNVYTDLGYQEGIDPMSRLFDLSTFLGHVSPSSTAVYLTITTELLDCASNRFAQFASNSRKECMR